MPARLKERYEGEIRGQLIEREGPIHLSNVALRDPKDKKPTRVKTIVEHGKRMRASARTGAKF